jgi:hypothetical protein
MGRAGGVTVGKKVRWNYQVVEVVAGCWLGTDALTGS